MSFWVRDKQFYHSLVVLAIPIILQNIITHGVTLADNMMVGQLGDVKIAGLYFSNYVQYFLQMLLLGLDASIVVLASQYWGKHDCEHIKDVFSIAMRIALCITCLFTACTVLFPHVVMRLMTDNAEVIASGASYLRIVGISYVLFGVSITLLSVLRSVEMVRIGLYNSIVALVINVSGNYLFISGHCGFPAMGVRGAALATVISRAIELFVVLYFALKVDRNLRLKTSDFLRWDKEIFHDLLKYGTPLVAGQAVWAVNLFLRAFITGSMEKEAMAAMSITDAFDGLLCIGTFGLASAVGITTGKTIGRGEFNKMKTQARTMQVIFLGIGLLTGLTAILFSNAYLSCYNITPHTREIAQTFMLVLTIVLVFRCYQAPCLIGLVKAGGDTAFVFKNDSFFVFFVVFPSALLAQFYFHAQPWIVYACLLCDQVLKCFVAVVKINSFNWMKNLTRP
ncbi:MAG: MATE family efflux transporter [Lentisphaeria bacterium]|nr:MATE family efflux transporter [Lentisphaeria bacterium]